MHSNRLGATLLCAAVLLVAVSAASPPKETLIFSDDFNTFNFSTWQHVITLSGEGNWEFEYYTNNRSNSFVEDGQLYLQPTLTADTIGEAEVISGYTMDLWGGVPGFSCTSNSNYGCLRTSGAGGNILNPIQSARVRTAESFSFKYGRVEIVAQLPKGDWLWPAIWMLPKWNAYGNWPASGEIDIMESRGNAPSYAPGGCNMFGSTLHWGPYFGQDMFPQTHAEYTLPSGDLTQGMHTYGMVWNETGLYTYIDSPSQIVLSVDMSSKSFWEKGGWNNATTMNPWRGQGNNAPFDQEFFLIMNVAVGGTVGYFPDGVGGKPWSDTSSHASNEFWSGKGQWMPTWKGSESALRVDSVKVWKFE